MEEHLSPLAITHLLQHTLRSLCIHENSQWVYAVFWRILPRNYPPPKWDGQGGYDRSRGNRRNWILVWEDGFCNFATAASADAMNNTNSSDGGDQFQGHYGHQHQGLQPELFFKMSHEIYNYGEGLIGKVAADHSHKWIYKEPNEQEINFLSAWHNSTDSQPRTWEAQFQSGIKTIALIAVREGVVQLGAINKVVEDLSYVVLLRKKFSYIESIPGVLLPHPSSSSCPPSSILPFRIDPFGNPILPPPPHHHHHLHDNHSWPNHYQGGRGGGGGPEYYDQVPPPTYKQMITPSMSSLEALLSKLPSVVPPGNHHCPKEETTTPAEAEEDGRRDDVAGAAGESSSSMSGYGRSGNNGHDQFHLHHHDLNVNCSAANNGYFE